MKKNKIDLITNPCLEANNCSDPVCQGYLAGIHQINVGIFNGLVENLFGSNPPAPVEKLKDDLDLTKMCSAHRIDLAYDEGNNTQNDIVVKVKEGYVGTANKAFSLALFNGVKAMFNPDSYHFSKGKNGNTVCVLFFAKKNNQIVYYGNLSEAYPIVGKFHK